MNSEFRFEVLSLYAQIALLDAQDTNAYPEWKTGEEKAVFSTHGIAIATAGDVKIEVIVRTEEISLGENIILCASTIIDIGQDGIIVGNIPASNIHKIPWKAGRSQIKVYTNHTVPTKVTKVIFVLE